MTGAYEEVLALIDDLPVPISDDAREIKWCGPGIPVGIARTPGGRIEIFLDGIALKPHLRRVADAVEYQAWYRATGSRLLANRLLLPGAGHFDQVAAFLCTELIRNGAATDLDGAFRLTEPLIELAIESLLLSEETMTGLCGELIVLDAHLLEAKPEDRRVVLEAWKGFGRTARDFQFAHAGIEVKTTTQLASSHLFSGIHQLEPGHGVGGALETEFMVASVGLEWVGDDDADSITLPGLVGRILARLNATVSDLRVGDFIDNVAAYGGDGVVGYDHRTMSDSPRFRRPFRVRFVRAYDMSDPVIQLLTTDDLRKRPYIEGESLRLRVSFPDKVTGDINPIIGLSALARWSLRA